MRHLLTALVAAVEAALIALAGIAFIAVPTLLIGAVTLSLGVDLTTLTETMAGVWMLGHGGGLSIAVSDAQAVSLGLGPDPLAFDITLAPLLIAIVTATLAWRMGYRFSSDMTTGAAAITGGSLGFIGASALIAVMAGSLLAAPIWAATALASLWFIIPAWGGFMMHHGDVVSTAWFKFKVALEQAGAPKLGWGAERYLARTLKLVAMLLLGLTALGAIGVSFSLLLGFVDIISLTQSMHLDFIGSLTFFLGQLAFLPTAMIWAVSWFAGPGFVVGSGSSVTPYETLLGPLPSIPLLAAIPDSWGSWGMLAMLFVVLVGVVIGTLAAKLPEFRRLTILRLTVISAAAVVITGLVLALAFALSSGSLGPGRLEAVGPLVWPAAAAASLELALGLIAGFALVRRGSDGADEARTAEPAYVDENELVELDVDADRYVTQPVARIPWGEENLEPGEGEFTAEKQRLSVPIESGEGRSVEFGVEGTADDVTREQEGVAWGEPNGGADPDDGADPDQETAEVSRIADPVAEETAEPWYRKAAKPRRHRKRPVFDPEKLEEEFSWESKSDDEGSSRRDE
ncbi:cell division protein PerM [Leucobacter chinensis]|uniref:cell division protein PerM n=1 Tax=Leucobacter chinensis TaxID=2851010 RepID=UPI001C230990|nr:DUF6350 family protein [Leucobacter chinensis]